MFKLHTLKARAEFQGTYLWVWYFAFILAGTVTISYMSGSKSTEDNQSFIVFVTIFGSIFIASVWRYVYVLNWLKKRTQKLIGYAAEQKYTFVDFRTNEFLHLPSTMLELGKRDRLFGNVFTNGTWIYGDYSYAMYQKSKYGEHKVRTVYYSVCYITLPRALPNVFFDSKVTKGREFKKRFDDSQRHSLEGNFDHYFDTYFPPHYTVDSLSFITPEVMQMMIVAKDYDIEINGNKLYLYGRFQAMPGQLVYMTSAAEAIYKTLLNNILTYRDERVAYKDGRNKVSIYGEELRKSIISDYFIAFFGILVLAAGVGLAVLVRAQFLVPATFIVIGGLMFVAAQNRIIKERAWRRNAKMLHEALKKRNTSGQSKHIAK